MCCQLGSLLKERSFWWKENSREDSTWISLVGQERHVLITCARPEEQAFVFNLMFKSSIYDIEERRYFFLEKEAFIRISITFFEITFNDFWTKIIPEEKEHFN
uniref:AAA_12 domain-containing protein n=1 Tax=Caenorhabditis tropicalis TaxID=1561998 RepID=A0A1I7TGJ2_9PELO